jgi:hypothetical protein
MNEKPLPPSTATRTDQGEERVPSDLASVRAGELRTPAAATNGEASPVAFTRLSHEILFVDPPPRCDVCDMPLTGDESDDEGNAFAGHGLYIWVRGGQTVYEEPPLCAACGTAIGMSALARWDSEEEEG